MKKIQSIWLMSLGILVFLGGIFFFITSQNRGDTHSTLAQEQEVFSSSGSENLQNQEYISPEKQRQLEEITKIYTKQEQAYHVTVENIIRKYNSNFLENDAQTLLSIIEQSNSPEELAESSKQQLGISFLQADIRKMLESKESLDEGKDLEFIRLQAFHERNKNELYWNIQKLLELSITDTLRENTSLASPKISQFSQTITQQLFEKDTDIMAQDSWQEQQSILRTSLYESLDPISELSSWEKKILIIRIIEDIWELEILSAPEENIDEDLSSSLPKFLGFDILQNLASFVFPWVYASESATLTPQEREILILKTEIFIEKILQESIETEILYNRGDISQSEYEMIIQDNLIELEELVILKNSLENDAQSISLDDIQRFNLWAYVDDSTEIQNLPVLAYIQEKTGHIIVRNLNGSSKLWEENMSLYSWYGIETLSNATVTLVFSDESILRLEPLSRVTISNPNNENINVSVDRGTIWARVLKPLLSGDVFTIDSESVSLWVRGTSLSFTKNTSDTIINIVDSYSSDWTASVTLTDSMWAQSSIQSGKEISIDTSGNINISDKNRAQLINDKPKVVNFLREDLRYLSLLLDDRQRGFYNTPIVSENDSDNFIQKIIGELEVSLPNPIEVPLIIQNPELWWELVHTGSIYHIIQKDMLISQIKDNPIWNTAAKISAIRDLDMQALEDELGNKRNLENLFHYEISTDIIEKTNFTTKELENIFLEFPLEDAQEDARILAEAKRNLSINNGSTIVSSDINLPESLSWVSISWESTDPDVLSRTGRSIIPQEDTNVILIATLQIWKLTTTKDFWLIVIPRELSKQEELQAAQDLITEYIYEIAGWLFDDQIDLPDFTENWIITPLISWQWSEMVNEDGTTNRPPFRNPYSSWIDINWSLGDFTFSFGSSAWISTSEYRDTTVTMVLTHPISPDVNLEKKYNIKIKQKDGTPAQIANMELDEAVTIFQNYFFGPSINTSLFYPTISPKITVDWLNGNPWISQSWEITQPSYNQWDREVEIRAKLSHKDIGTPRFIDEIDILIKRQDCQWEIIGEYCYELIASADYDEAGDFDLIDMRNNQAVPRWAPNVNLSSCGWNDPFGNGSNPNDSWNCAWTWAQAIASMYNYDVTQIWDFNPVKSWLTYKWESWIIIDNEDDPAWGGADSLWYDISELGLDDDWAIEISVLGEDLKRDDISSTWNPLLNTLLSIDWEIIVRNWKKSFWKNDPFWPIEYNWIINNNFQNVILTSKALYYNKQEVIEVEPVIIAWEIKIWTDKNNSQQWNGIINRLNIYKKN